MAALDQLTEAFEAAIADPLSGPSSTPCGATTPAGRPRCSRPGGCRTSSACASGSSVRTCSTPGPTSSTTPRPAPADPPDGKPRVIAETGAGQHGVATATVAALLGQECVVYMGEEDTRRQHLNVVRMRLLGAEVRPVATGTATLKDAINEALRDWVESVGSTHYSIGSVVGPHPYPLMVREFQRVIGDEARAQVLQAEGRLPDLAVACVGAGPTPPGCSPASSTTTPSGWSGSRPAAAAPSPATTAPPRPRRGRGPPRRPLLRPPGPRRPDPPDPLGVGRPRLPRRRPRARLLEGRRPGHLRERPRPAGPRRLPPLARTEGILPALEPAHAIGWLASAAQDGRVAPAPWSSSTCPAAATRTWRRSPACWWTARPGPGRWVIGAPYGPCPGLDPRTRRGRRRPWNGWRGGWTRCAGRAGGAGRVRSGGVPGPGRVAGGVPGDGRGRGRRAEVGPPYSDPLIDGPVIQQAVTAALEAGTRLDDVLGLVNELTASVDTPVVLLVYYNLVAHRGPERFAAELAAAGLRGGRALPPEEAGEWLEATRAAGIALFPDPTGARLAAVAKAGRGFVYAQASLGVTGLRTALAAGIEELVGRVRAHTDLPVCAGIGVSNPDQAAAVARFADGAIVGTALVRALADGLPPPHPHRGAGQRRPHSPGLARGGNRRNRGITPPSARTRARHGPSAAPRSRPSWAARNVRMSALSSTVRRTERAPWPAWRSRRSRIGRSEVLAA